MDEGGVAVQPSFISNRDPAEVLDPSVEAFHESFHSATNRPISRLVQSEGTTACGALPIPLVHRDAGLDPATTKIGSNLDRILRRVRVEPTQPRPRTTAPH